MKIDLSFIESILDSHIANYKILEDACWQDNELKIIYRNQKSAIEHIKQDIKHFIAEANKLVEKQK